MQYWLRPERSAALAPCVTQGLLGLPADLQGLDIASANAQPAVLAHTCSVDPAEALAVVTIEQIVQMLLAKHPEEALAEVPAKLVQLHLPELSTLHLEP